MHFSMSSQSQDTLPQQSQTGARSFCRRREVEAMLDSININDIELLPPGIREYCLYMHNRLTDYAYGFEPLPVSDQISDTDKQMEMWMFPLAAFYHSWRGDETRAFADARYMLDCYLS